MLAQACRKWPTTAKTTAGDGYVVRNEAGKPLHPGTLSRCGPRWSPPLACHTSGCTTRHTPAGPLCTCTAARPRPPTFCISLSRAAGEEWIVVCLGFGLEYRSVPLKPGCAGPAGRNEQCPRVS
jgi:hypothetical protein